MVEDIQAEAEAKSRYGIENHSDRSRYDDAESGLAECEPKVRRLRYGSLSGWSPVISWICA
jgi:hypothetical protein